VAQREGTTGDGDGTDLPPLVLMAHYDVVPVAGQDWSRDPFSGLIEGGVVHGRGAIDDKGALVAILEAVEPRGGRAVSAG
jgi:carboxypeptidase PM20D1